MYRVRAGDARVVEKECYVLAMVSVIISTIVLFAEEVDDHITTLSAILFVIAQ